MIHNQHLKVSNRNYWNAKKIFTTLKRQTDLATSNSVFSSPPQKYGKGKEQQRNTP